jgi:hypothetical protein
MPFQWILFCPQLPATPSSPRVMVWRKMRSAGSLGLDNGLWILPDTQAAQGFIREIQAYVAGQGGASKTFSACAFDETTEAEILAGFRRDRDEEYFEVIEQCDDFLVEIDKEIGRKNYSFAEYEENEEDLVKLEGWYQKVRQRDFCEASRAGEADAALQRCRQALSQFATEVFNKEQG